MCGKASIFPREEKSAKQNIMNEKKERTGEVMYVLTSPAIRSNIRAKNGGY